MRFQTTQQKTSQRQGHSEISEERDLVRFRREGSQKIPDYGFWRYPILENRSRRDSRETSGEIEKIIFWRDSKEKVLE